MKIVKLSEVQLNAIAPITTGDVRMAILTGGPGCGKTTCSREVMDRWSKKYGPGAITALSPTGKASRRFVEATGYPCHTIHKALMSWEGTAQAPEDLPLHEDLRAVVVDETSMIDMYLMARLLKALIKTIDRILFVGDSDQLPSVGPGAVLRDFIACGRIPVFKLTKIWRQDDYSWISINAMKINSGERPESHEDSTDYFENICDDHNGVVSAIKTIVTENPTAQVMVPMRKYDIGAEKLNEIVRDTINPARGQKEWKAGMITFRVGDRVIHKKNNYRLEVMNGEVGIVSDVTKLENPITGREYEALLVDYGHRRVTYDREVAMEQLRLAFALTIHSMQGSEMDLGVVVIHSSHSYLLSRSLFYTALTRAKKKVWVVGDEKGIQLAVKKNNPRERKTLLVERINEAFASGV